MVMFPLFLPLIFLVIPMSTKALECWHRFGTFSASKERCILTDYCYTNKCPDGVRKGCATDENYCEIFGTCLGTNANCWVCRGDLCNGEGETDKAEPEPEPTNPKPEPTIIQWTYPVELESTSRAPKKTEPESAFECYHQEEDGEITTKACAAYQKFCVKYVCDGKVNKDCSGFDCNDRRVYFDIGHQSDTCFSYSCDHCDTDLCNGAEGGPVIGMALLVVAMIGTFIIGFGTFDTFNKSNYNIRNEIIRTKIRIQKKGKSFQRKIHWKYQKIFKV